MVRLRFQNLFTSLTAAMLAVSGGSASATGPGWPTKLQTLEKLWNVNTFTHSRGREAHNSTAYPWRAIGKLQQPDSDSSCTAFLVAQSIILTNRHCVEKDPKTDASVVYGQYRFSPGMIGNKNDAASYGAYVIDDGLNHEADDWALLALDSPVGQQLGYLGIDTGEIRLKGYQGDLPSLTREFEKAWCDVTSSPFSFLRSEAESQMSDAWITDYNNPASPRQCMAGYPGDLGSNSQVISHHCGLLGQDKSGLWIHDCAGTRGASGSPIFYFDRGKVFVSALNRGESRPGETSLLNVPFSSWNYNTAVKTPQFIKNLQRAIFSTHSKMARIQFLNRDNIWQRNTEFTSTDDFLKVATDRSVCTTTLIKDMQANGILDQDFQWNSVIQSRIDQKTVTFPGMNKTMPASLSVYVNNYTEKLEVGLSIIGIYGVSSVAWETISEGSNPASACKMTQSQILYYLDGIK